MIGQILKSLRKERGLTQESLAEELGMTKFAIRKYESNDRTPDFDVMIKFADFFDVTTDYLLGRSFSRTLDTKYLVAHDKRMFEAMKKLSIEDQAIILEVVNSVNILFESPLYLGKEFNKDLATIFSRMFSLMANMNARISEYTIEKPFNEDFTSVGRNKKAKYSPQKIKDVIYGSCAKSKLRMDSLFLELVELYIQESLKSQKALGVLEESDG